MESLNDVEILILAVGTNDLQFLFYVDEKIIENGLKYLITLAQKKNIQIVLIPPVIIKENVVKGNFAHQFDKTSIIKSKQAVELYKKAANIFGCNIFDFNEFVKPSDYDGLHFDAPAHALIAQKLSKFIISMNTVKR